MEIKDQATGVEAETDKICIEDKDKKVHPWRRCGKGKHFVKAHPVHKPPSKKNPEGKNTTCHKYCAKNPSGKEELSFDEIKYISATYFISLSGLPTAGVLTEEFKDADKYDAEIRGWTQYWNDIFKLDDPLDPNVVKALIATESSFDTKPKKYAHVYGLMQIIGKTHQYLRDAKNELSDYLIRVSISELLDASCNICAGVRWLFRKKETAARVLKREATWEEVVEDYKAILMKRIHKEPYNPKPMEHFRKYYKRLREG